jgi:cobalt/nickel transport system permease protein
MVASSLDRYVHRESRIHQLDPRVKVIVTLLFIVSNVLLPDDAWLAYITAALYLLVATHLAGFTPWFIVKRSFIALPFALAAVSLLFTVPGEPLLQIPLGSRALTISDAGLLRFTSILLRSWLSVQMAILLTATTPFPDLMHALRHLRVPAVIVAIIGFMYRYLFVLADEAGRLLRARAARSAVSAAGRGGGSLSWRAQVAGNMVGQLFLRSMERSDRVYNAMLARGYQGQLLTMNPHVMERGDWALGAVALLLIAATQLIGYLS